MNVLGIDIGYSNLKIAYGHTDKEMKTALRPAGAAPADRFGTRFDGKAQDDFLRVLVGDEMFVAGVAADRAEMWERSLHADYAKTQSYQALLHGGLLLSEMNEIDVLVTGLPVNQFQDEARRKQLEAQFTGEHRITPKRTVTVKKVKVVAQPIGGLLDFIDQQEAQGDDGTLQIDDETRVLVVDPGFFSLDWVMVSNGQLQHKSSGTSFNATSILLEQAGKLISSDYGSVPSTESLENAVRNGKPSVLVTGQRVIIAPYLEKASELMQSNVAQAIQTSLRTERVSADIIVMVGGGAKFFQKALAEAFPRLQVVTPKSSVLSNARGFWIMGAHG